VAEDAPGDDDDDVVRRFPKKASLADRKGGRGAASVEQEKLDDTYFFSE